MNNTIIFPSLFISHGAPTLYLTPGPTHDFLKELGSKLPAPQSILCISAHWTSKIAATSQAEQPELIYDFFGFPQELYEVEYSAPGAPSLARQVYALLTDAGLETNIEATRGLDHGAWIPLSMMYPNANIPITQLSVQPHRSADYHFKVGRALQPLRQQGVLIISSGGATHNLRDANIIPDAPVADYARWFADWLEENITGNKIEVLLDYKTNAPEAYKNHPTPEHFLPLFVALGAALENEIGRILHRSYELSTLAMDAYGWGTAINLNSSVDRSKSILSL